MRKAHAAGLWSALRHGRMRWLARTATRAVALRMGASNPPPLFATLAVTYHCNHRCFMCDFPARADRQPATEELIQRVHALADQGVLALGLTGGEPLVHRGLFDVIAAARTRGLLVHLNSNGSELLHREVPRLLDAGLHSINLSLDGADAATHDRLRGAPGAFVWLERTVAALLAQRRGREPRIGLVAVVSRDNAHDLDALVTRAESWGVDRLGFLPHHGLVDDGTALQEDDARALETALTRLGPRLDNSDAYLRAFPRFLSGEPTPVHCSAPRSHVAIDPAGTAYPCVPLMTLERSGVPWSPHGPRPMPTDADREEVCRRCWWNCHRELDLSLGLLRGASPSSSSPH